ncbi:MAG: TetR/AcrR family transcriptional regulator [Thermomicrobiales bacterium]|nr:TetR/AcrR family transcriptional regulator [Thermomicrobiales bacterium]
MAANEPTTSTRDPVATRAAILAAARALVLSNPGRLSIRRVAEEAGITHGTIYLYFRDKDDLLYQVAEASAHEMVAHLRRMPRNLSAEERLRRTWRDLVDAALASPDAFHFVFTLRPARMTGPSSVPPLAAILEAPLIDAMTGLTVGVDAPQDARALLLSIVGFVEAVRSGIATTDELRRASDRTIDLILAGLRVQTR